MSLPRRSRTTGNRPDPVIQGAAVAYFTRVGINWGEGGHGPSRAERGAARRDLAQQDSSVAKENVTLSAVVSNANGSGGSIVADGGKEVLSGAGSDGTRC